MKTISVAFLFIATVSASTCVPGNDKSSADDDAKIYEGAFDVQNDLLVFGTDALEDGGPIQGLLKVDDPTLRSGSAEMLQRALISCGEARVIIDLSTTHNEFVSVPLKVNNPFRAKTDLQLVECVQQNTSFGFFVGVGRGPDTDARPFKSLYAKKS